MQGACDRKDSGPVARDSRHIVARRMTGPRFMTGPQFMTGPRFMTGLCVAALWTIGGLWFAVPGRAQDPDTAGIPSDDPAGIGHNLNGALPKAPGTGISDYITDYTRLPLGAFPRSEQGALIYEGPPVVADDASRQIEALSDLRQVNFAGFGPPVKGEPSALVLLRDAETPQLYVIPAPGALPVKLTSGENRVSLALARPWRRQILFALDAGGDEDFQFFLRGEKAESLAQLTEPGTRNLTPLWSPDGKQLLWAAARSEDPNYDLVWMEPDRPASRKVLMHGVGAIAPLAFSLDGRRALIGRYLSIAESERYVVDFETGKVTQIAPELHTSYLGGVFSRDGHSLIVATHEGGEFLRLMRVDIASGAMQLIADFGADVEAFAASPDLRTLAVVVNRNGASELWFLKNADRRKPGKPRRGPLLSAGVIEELVFAPGGHHVGFSFSASDRPGDAFRYDLRRRILTSWTVPDAESLAEFRPAEAIHYPTFDPGDPANPGEKRQIPAWVLRPGGPGPHPVIILAHGGPESQARPRFNPTLQFLARHFNAVVIEPNIRGSSGYGKSFLALDNGVRRADAVRDIGALLEWIATQPEFDPKRVLIMGGSYGGFVTLAALADYSDQLAGGISMVGIGDFPRFLANTRGYRRDLRRAEYGDERDPTVRAALDAVSPARRAHRIRKPLFIQQGLNDPRVPAGEALTLAARIRASGGEAWVLLARDEGHGFVRKTNNQFRRQAEMTFIRRLFGQPASGPEAVPAKEKK